MNVKTANSGFLKQECLAALKQRGDTVWYRVRIMVGVLQHYVFAGGLLCLCHRAQPRSMVALKSDTATVL
jgi:hypothetical protein